MERNYKSTINHRLPAELVCMVNDGYVGIKQFPVPIKDKIYYGCSESCVDRIQDSDEFRYGIDPLTKEKVDKVGAYIVRESDITKAVFYFKSKENYEMYIHELAN